MVTRDTGQLPTRLTYRQRPASCKAGLQRLPPGPAAVHERLVSPGSLLQVVGQSSIFVYGLAMTVYSVSPVFNVANDVISSQSLKGVKTVPNSVKALKYPKNLFRLRVPLKSNPAEWGYVPF